MKTKVAAAVGAEGGNDGLVGQRQPGIQFGDACVVPARDDTCEDVGHHLARELQRVDLRQVVGHHHGAHAGRNVDYGGHLGHLLVGEVGVAAGEVDDLVLQVAHAAARADAAVGDLVACVVGEVFEGERVEGLGEGGPGARELDGGPGVFGLRGAAVAEQQPGDRCEDRHGEDDFYRFHRSCCWVFFSEAKVRCCCFGPMTRR